jgi:ribosomal-protein-alanine N-acetyltransferase
MDNSKNINLEIRKLCTVEEAHECARLMSSSEPWITLRRTYDNSMRMLSDSSREVYLAIVNNEIVGFIVLIMSGAFVGYIQTVAVKPQWKNKGIGSRLIKFAEKRIFDQAPNVFMCVSSFNEKAQKLYKRLGYEVIGELKDYVVPGHSEILLRKTLAPLTKFKVTDDHRAPTPILDVREERIPDNVVIRLARMEDMQALCKLYNEFHEFHVRGVPDRLVSLEKTNPHHDAELRNNLDKIINQVDSVILVVEVANQVVGLAEVYIREDEPNPARVAYMYGHLQSLLVTKAFRRQGVGEKLLQAAESWAKGRGATEMRLDIWEFPKGPLRFYEKTGYRTLRRKLVKRL